MYQLGVPQEVDNMSQPHSTVILVGNGVSHDNYRVRLLGTRHVTMESVTCGLIRPVEYSARGVGFVWGLKNLKLELSKYIIEFAENLD